MQGWAREMDLTRASRCLSPARALAQAIDERFRTPMASPWAAVGPWRVGPGVVTLMNMACVAFMAHYNGVKYYEELEDRTVKKYVVTIGWVLLPLGGGSGGGVGVAARGYPFSAGWQPRKPWSGGMGSSLPCLVPHAVGRTDPRARLCGASLHCVCLGDCSR